MEYTKLYPKPGLEHIALTFSGGGFRAAAFALGCLSYMEKLTIDGNPFTSYIDFIASASGGSITNLFFTAAQRKGRSFREVYKEMNEKMFNGTALVDLVFEIIKDNNYWKDRPQKSRNLINAFSIAYDELLFEGENFGVYWNKPVGKVVREICANSTEFNNGMLFRFQTDGKESTGMITGNRFLHFSNADPSAKQALKQIKLADILAASSCFPVGFEPLLFPEDFTYAGLTDNDLRSAMVQDIRYSHPHKGNGTTDKPLSFGLMDGGIDDNQGIDSLMLAEERLQRRNKFGYDLFICCDVSSNYTGGYTFPGENTKSPLLKLSLRRYILAVAFLFAISLAGIITHTLFGLSCIFLGASGLIAIVLALLCVSGFKAYRHSLKGKDTFGILIFQHIGLFLKLKLSVILQMIGSRATSAGYLAAVVFLKKIRRISYERLFEKISEIKVDDDNTKLKHWSDFALQNAIYLLSRKNDVQRRRNLKAEKLPSLLEPGARLQDIADTATEMDTTLWFDRNHIAARQPAALIAAGQFTTCYNLLRYAFRFNEPGPQWKGLQAQLLKDWQAFKEDPYWLYDQYGKETIHEG